MYKINTTCLKKRSNIFFAVLVRHEPISIQIGRNVLGETFNKTVQKFPISPKIRANTTSGNWKWQTDPSMQYLHVHLNTETQLAVIVLKIVKHVVGHIIFTSYARNICLERECKHVDAETTSPTAHWMNSVIQTVHSLLMRHLSTSTSEILVRAGGRQFRVCKDNVTY